MKELLFWKIKKTGNVTWVSEKNNLFFVFFQVAYLQGKCETRYTSLLMKWNENQSYNCVLPATQLLPPDKQKTWIKQKNRDEEREFLHAIHFPSPSPAGLQHQLIPGSMLCSDWSSLVVPTSLLPGCTLPLMIFFSGTIFSFNKDAEMCHDAH